ncbi:MAG: hypothetical protein F4048_10610 [Gammaproteobacteria bacterium]|nr:hypothetical protein [Gammaproteobacteria bacterium]
MDIFEAISLTQDRLVEEGSNLRELLEFLRGRISPALIGEHEWQRILTLAKTLPITMGAQPFGFELPLHDSRPTADMGVSLASGNRSGNHFEERARRDGTDETAGAVKRLFAEMETANSPLQAVVGRKLMLEYDIGSASGGDIPTPGIFLRPNERTLFGGAGLERDVGTVVDALVSCVGWRHIAAERQNAERAYLAQPVDTRLDSFGVFPSRGRSIRLAIMGFKTPRDICSYLESLRWPGEHAAVEAVIGRIQDRANIERIGLNLDVRADGLGPTLGLTPIVKQRYTNDSRVWIDGLTEWQPMLDALRHEALVVSEKLQALADWASKPTTLYGKSGRFVMLRGIHHIKLVISGNQLHKAKAYVYMVLSGAI